MGIGGSDYRVGVVAVLCWLTGSTSLVIRASCIGPIIGHKDMKTASPGATHQLKQVLLLPFEQAPKLPKRIEMRD